MMPLPLAQATAAESNATSWLMVLALLTLVQLMLGLKQLIGGNKGERQIEPTQLAGITAELGKQTQTLNKLDREMGVTTATIAGIEKKFDALSADQKRETENIFRRINAISMESSVTSNRLDDHLGDTRRHKA